MSASDVVQRFLARWGVSFAEVAASIQDTFTDDTVYENVGLAVTTGIDEAVRFMRSFVERMGLETVRIRTLHIAQTGDFVLTERIDAIHAADGTPLGEHRIMGIFEVRGEKIVAWRDYFDTAATQDDIMGVKAEFDTTT